MKGTTRILSVNHITTQKIMNNKNNRKTPEQKLKYKLTDKKYGENLSPLTAVIV